MEDENAQAYFDIDKVKNFWIKTLISKVFLIFQSMSDDT